MLAKKELEIRKKIWTELSEFYLDTEISDEELLRKGIIFKNSGFSMNEIEAINYFEVGPLLIMNLRGAAGEWNGFDHAWLHSAIGNALRKERNNNIRLFKIVTDYFRKKEIDHYTKKHFDRMLTLNRGILDE